MTRTLIAGGARTPIGKLSGSLGSLPATALGSTAIRGALSVSEVDPADVNYVIFGQVLGAGAGQITSRQAAIGAGIGMGVPATTINKVCLSGMNTIYLADLMIQAGKAEVVVVGGMESMTHAPHVLRGSRSGFKYGHAEMLDTLLHDGLTCAFDKCSMGESTENYAKARKLTRQRQDEFAALSHERAAAAHKSGFFGEEIVGVDVPQRKGDPLVVLEDEGIRPGTSVDALAKLKPAFSPDGTITAGNSSQLSDGAAALVLVSDAAARRLALNPIGEVVGYGQVAGPDTSLLSQPSAAITAALSDAKLAQEQVDVYEINEAFAAVALASMDDLGVSEETVNVNGGAIALGHPIGMSGARLPLTLLHELRRRGGGAGVAGLCGGGGQGDAIVVRTI